MIDLAPPEFVSFSKMPRLRRECAITEKIDGTNGQIYNTEDGRFFVGSRNRWITPEADNFGFARWAYENRAELEKLGPGRHFGEWWGAGIQRRYGLQEKRFSLFNVGRWSGEDRDKLPACVSLVPLLYVGIFSDEAVNATIDDLRTNGSRAVPGFMNPEGIVVYMSASRSMHKFTLDGDGHKGT
jgi:RNA ligase-like protein